MDTLGIYYIFCTRRISNIAGGRSPLRRSAKLAEHGRGSISAEVRTAGGQAMGEHAALQRNSASDGVQRWQGGQTERRMADSSWSMAERS